MYLNKGGLSLTVEDITGKIIIIIIIKYNFGTLFKCLWNNGIEVEIPGCRTSGSPFALGCLDSR